MIAFEKQRVEIQSMVEKLVSERDRLTQDVSLRMSRAAASS